jgi:hypothetical protein
MKYNFIIPYRNRKEHLDELIRRYTEVLKNKDIDIEFFIIHQMNPKEFNRGAMKNIGFLEVSKTRPDGLFVFHDVDVFPVSWELIKYETKPGYFRRPIYNGFEGNLGLICSCWKEDFEKTNGFPNYWGWGVEDETLYKRALKNGINIDESNMLNYKDDKKVINPNHYRNAEKERASGIKNKDILNNELKNGENLDGLTNIQYEVISSFEMAPRFRILNVDFKLLNEN